MTSGIVAQVGRIHGKVEFDQTTVTAFPGSSGGGVYLQDGRYVGMLVRGAGENFNLIVPIRRMVRWAEDHDIMWALDPSLKAPSIKEIKKLPVETVSKDEDEDEGEDEDKESSFGFRGESLPFLIRTSKK